MTTEEKEVKDERLETQEGGDDEVRLAVETGAGAGAGSSTAVSPEPIYFFSQYCLMDLSLLNAPYYLLDLTWFFSTCRKKLRR